MQWLARISVSRPVFTWVMSLVLLVLGVASVGSLPVDRLPDIDVPFVTVVVAYPGASPAQVETEVTEILEEAVGSVSGLSELRTTSYEGLSVIAVQFELPPRIEKLDPDAQPIYYVARRGPGTPQELTEFADDELKGPLEGLPGWAPCRSWVVASARSVSVWILPASRRWGSPSQTWRSRCAVRTWSCQAVT